MKIQLLIIDPQNDFCYPGIELSNLKPDVEKMVRNILHIDIINPGALFVPGADQDMKRLSEMIERMGKKLDDIHVTVDTHHLVDIAHPIMLVDSHGNHPGPFTIISASDMKNGLYRATYAPYTKRIVEYTEHLESNGRYPLCVWPPHCLIGRFGYGIVQPLADSLLKWENEEFAQVNYVTKGSNFWTEHYSAVQADVPDPQDPGTQLNWDLIKMLQDADEILLAGEAKSHCLANTVIDIANNFGEENIKKLVLLEDCTSNVPDPPGTTLFTDFSNKFVKDMVARGMRISNSVDYLK